jgi:tetratricopeptide (TPR) repeat protein
LTSTGLLLVLSLTLSAGGTGADEHLLAGARLFREAQFAEALVEFQVAHRLGAPEAAQYAAVALVKLGRPEEALEAFGRLDTPGRDALVDYYRAVAAFDAHLYQAADRILLTVADRAGPRIGEQVVRMRADIAKVLVKEPTPAAIDWYLERCSAEKAAGRSALAQAYCREASLLSERRADRYRHAEALQGAASSTRSGTP